LKAILCERYGPPEALVLAEVPAPRPKPHQVLVKVHACSVNSADWHLMRADPFPVRLMFGLFKPKFKILGGDVAGVVEALGPGVTRFKVGDAVLGCLSAGGFGAFAEYACAAEDALVLKPEGSSFEQAAALPLAAMTALQALRGFGKVRPGDKVLINGASGGVGTFAVQIAKALGAEVSAVCSSANAATARSLGADHVFDYAHEDFSASGRLYDVILGANGFQPLASYKRALAPNGRYAMVGGAPKQMTQAMFLGPLMSRGGLKLGNVMMKPNLDDLIFLAALMEKGTITPVIDRSYPLAQVPDAIRHLELGHAKGKVVITVPS
jgi:NADPH:quinone reductase-like Zn-dependent oxidoreductase